MKRFVIALAFVLGTCTMTSAESKQGIGLEEAISIATKEVPGTVIEAEIEKGIYEIKIKAEGGERIKFKIDPKAYLLQSTVLGKGVICFSINKRRHLWNHYHVQIAEIPSLKRYWFI